MTRRCCCGSCERPPGVQRRSLSQEATAGQPRCGSRAGCLSAIRRRHAGPRSWPSDIAIFGNLSLPGISCGTSRRSFRSARIPLDGVMHGSDPLAAGARPVPADPEGGPARRAPPPAAPHDDQHTAGRGAGIEPVIGGSPVFSVAGGRRNSRVRPISAGCGE